jgi:type II secretory pathway pseudopilin PulG
MKFSMSNFPFPACLRGKPINSGQTLIETLVALSVSLVLLSMATVATVTALKNAQNSKNQNQASKFAEQGVEIMRQLRDGDWTTFSTLSGNYCMADTCSSLVAGIGVCGKAVGACGKNVGMFSRTVTVEPGTGCVLPGNTNPQIKASRVTVAVAWADNTCPDTNTLCRQTTIVSCLGNVFSDPNL